MKSARNHSWIQLNNHIPFRTTFFYWDEEESLFKVRTKLKYVFVHKDYIFKGIVITCWTKDKEEIIEELNKINSRLEKENQDYKQFIINWHQNMLSFKKYRFHNRRKSKK